MKFNYQARTKAGEIQTGTVEAGSRETAVETLQHNDLMVVFLEEFSSIPLYARSLKFFQRIKTKDLTIFYRQLAILFSADVSPLDALRILGEQARTPVFREIIFEIETDVRGGEPLSQAMEKHPKAFPPFYVNVVKAGEAAGNLHEVLNYLADHAEKDYNLMQKVKGAFTYPIVISSLFIIVAVLMMIFVVPQLASMLVELGQKLPIATRILIGTSQLLRSYLWLIILVIAGIVVFIVRYIRKTPKGRIVWDNIKLKIPVFGLLLQKIYLARFTENLRTLLQGGIPILRALEITASVIGNKIYESIIMEAKEKVRVGETISSALSNYPKRVPSLVSQMVGVGEKTAQLDIILEKLANFYQQDVDRMVNNMTQLIEPIMILVLGAGVGFLVSSILMPIYNIASGL